MTTGRKLRDQLGLGHYLRTRVLPLAPATEPVPFRGQLQGESETLPFFEDLERDLIERPGAVWSVVGEAGTGKTLLGRWAAARWARAFLAQPDDNCLPLHVNSSRLHAVTHGFTRWDLPSIVASAGVSLSREARRQLIDALADQPIVLVVDSEHDGTIFKMRPLGNARVLHLGLAAPADGPTVRVGPWDRETALLGSYRLGGPAAVERLKALELSPAAELITYPLFVDFLCRQEGAGPETIEVDGGVPSFLAGFHSWSALEHVDFTSWCRRLFRADSLEDEWNSAALRLHLIDSRSWGRVFRAYLLAHLIQTDRVSGTLCTRLLSEADLETIDRAFNDTRARRRVWRPGTGRDGWTVANFLGLKWRLSRQPIQESLLRHCREVSLPDYRFTQSVVGLHLSRSNLSGVSFALGATRDSTFTECDFSHADLRRMEIADCRFLQSRFRLARLRRTAFQGCYFQDVDLKDADVHGVVFGRTHFTRVRFPGCGRNDRPCRFFDSELSECDIRHLARGGLFWSGCRLGGLLFCGLEAATFHGEGSEFHTCDFLDFSSRGARLARTRFESCVLAGVDLREADLRDSQFVGVEFQPDPSSRPGLLDEWTRTYPMYGSRYAEDVSDGVYGDPELLRTADLRGADVRGLKLRHTDLFRVDLRGARMDDSFRREARRMKAFVDC